MKLRRRIIQVAQAITFAGVLAISGQVYAARDTSQDVGVLVPPVMVFYVDENGVVLSVTDNTDGQMVSGLTVYIVYPDGRVEGGDRW